MTTSLDKLGNAIVNERTVMNAYSTVGSIIGEIKESILNYGGGRYSVMFPFPEKRLTGFIFERQVGPLLTGANT